MPEFSQTGEIPLATAIRRYLDVALYLLIFTGFGTLASTGKLDAVTVVLVSAALLARGYVLVRRREALLSERWTNLLTIACVGFFVADEFLISRTFIDSLVHLVLFVMLVRLFSAQRVRDHFFLAGLSFAMVLAAAVLTVDSTFLVALAGFVLVATGTFILMEMMHAATGAAVLGRDPNVPRAYRKLSFAIATIAPVLLVLIFAIGGLIFFLLPRVSTGYFSALSGGSDLSTGFSDHVELGRIGQIQQSRAVVMHVRIEGDTGSRELKLRGVTLNAFNGRVWSNTHPRIAIGPEPDGHFDLRRLSAEGIPPVGYPMHYQVTMEPFINDVFFLLGHPLSLRGNYRRISVDTSADVYDSDTERPVTRYEADSVLRLPRPRHEEAYGFVYPPNAFQAYLQLPLATDARVPRLARQIVSNSRSPREMASAIEGYLRTHFKYTLQLPSTPPNDPIANFLFDRREGHCEYFASSMAVMLRTLGIPSRVVNGFSGGEFNDVSSQYVIRASEAHSWVEAYIPGEGWVEFDPTPASSGFTQGHWNRFMLYMDAMASFWRDWIVNYDLAHQLRLTQDASRGSRQIVGHAQAWAKSHYDRLLAWARKTQDRVGKATVLWGERALVLFVLILLAASLPRVIAFVRKLRVTRRPERAPQVAATLWYERMLQYVARQGWEKAPAQTPTEFVSVIKDDRLRTTVERFTEKYENARFGNSAEEASKLPELYEEVKNGESA